MSCVCVGNETQGQAEPTVDGIVETVAAPLVALLQCKTPGLQMPAWVPLCLQAFSGVVPLWPHPQQVSSVTEIMLPTFRGPQSMTDEGQRVNILPLHPGKDDSEVCVLCPPSSAQQGHPLVAYGANSCA